MPEQLLTAKDAARYLNVHVNTVKRLVKRGDLPAYRVGDRGDLRLSQDELEAWLRRDRQPGPGFYDDPNAEGNDR